MAALITNMAQREKLLNKVDEELQATESRLDATSAIETLASIEQVM